MARPADGISRRTRRAAGANKGRERGQLLFSGALEFLSRPSNPLCDDGKRGDTSRGEADRRAIRRTARSDDRCRLKLGLVIVTRRSRLLAPCRITFRTIPLMEVREPPSTDRAFPRCPLYSFIRSFVPRVSFSAFILYFCSFRLFIT